MINFPLDVGILGWASTLAFGLAVGMIVWGVYKGTK